MGFSHIALQLVNAWSGFWNFLQTGVCFAYGRFIVVSRAQMLKLTVWLLHLIGADAPPVAVSLRVHLVNVVTFTPETVDSVYIWAVAHPDQWDCLYTRRPLWPSGPRHRALTTCRLYLLAPLTGNERRNMGFKVLRIWPSPCRFPVSIPYIPMNETHLYSKTRRMMPVVGAWAAEHPDRSNCLSWWDSWLVPRLRHREVTPMRAYAWAVLRKGSKSAAAGEWGWIKGNPQPLSLVTILDKSSTNR